MSKRTSRFLFAALLLCACFAHSQVPVAMAPPIHFQFLNSSGQPLSNGKLFTYAAGTTTLQNTYVDSSGVTQNPDPILLDATGSPSNGSVQTGIFLSNTAWKFVAFDLNSNLQWTVDNVTTYFALTNSANTWTAAQTFSGQIVDTLTDNQIVLGTAGNQTTIDAPPASGNIALHLPSGTSQNILGSSAPAITNPTINGCPITTGVFTCFVLQNNGITGTTLNTLTKVINTTGTGALQIVAVTDTAGAIGILIGGAGITGSGIVETGGVVSCVFDGPTTAPDYVQISSTVAGNCHDSGIAAPGYPVSGQVIGVALSTNSGAGTYGVNFSAVGTAAHGTACASGAAITLNSSTTSQQIFQACPLQTAGLNLAGKAFRLTTNHSVTPSTSTSAASWGFGVTSALGTYAQIAGQGSSSSNWTGNEILTCVVTTAGATGSLACSSVDILTGVGSVALTQPSFVVTPVNLTGLFYVGSACSFGSASSSNSCTQSVFTYEQLN